MKNKILAFTLVFLLATSLVFVACAPKPAPTPAPAPAPAPAPVPAPTPAQPPKAIEWKAQHSAPAGSLQYKSQQRISDAVKKASAGRLVINVFPGGAVWPAGKEFDGLDQNAIQFNMDNGAWWSGKYPQAEIFNFVADGMFGAETSLWFTHGGGLDRLNTMLKDTNILAIAPFPMAPEVFLSSGKPLATVADFKGLRIRTAGTAVDGVIFAKMGASIVPVPGAELYESVKRGVVDAYQYGSPSMDLAVSFFEIIKYMYLSPVRQPSDNQVYVVNKKAWAEITDDLKEIVLAEAYKEGWTYYFNQVTSDTAAVEKFKSYGVNVAPMPKVIEDEFKKLAEQVYAEKSAANAAFKELLDNYNAFKNQIRAAQPRL